MMKTVLCFILVGWIIAMPMFAASKPLQPIRQFERGQLYRIGKINVVNVHGNYFEMGKQYGALLGRNMQAFYVDMTRLLVKKRGNSYAALQQSANALFATYPRRFQLLLEGMAKTSGLNIKQVIVLNAFEHFMFNSKYDKGGCSALAVWGHYTQTGQLLFGRNYDFSTNVNVFKKYLTVTVLHPIGEGNATMLLTFVGTLNATTDMNRHGLFLELNNGGKSVGGLSYNDRLSSPIELLGMMIDSDSLQEIDKAMHTVRPDFAFIISVANRDKAVSYEWAPFAVKVLYNPAGVLASTNHFVDPAWHTGAPSDHFFETVTRRKHLLQYATHMKGKITVKRLQDFLKMSLEKGGVTFYRAGPNRLYTAFQVIAVPAKRQIWLRLPNYQPWVLIPLNVFYRG